MEDKYKHIMELINDSARPYFDVDYLINTFLKNPKAKSRRQSIEKILKINKND